MFIKKTCSQLKKKFGRFCVVSRMAGCVCLWGEGGEGVRGKSRGAGSNFKLEIFITYFEVLGGWGEDECC